MVKDNETGECYRADKLLEGCIDNLLHDSTITSERRVRQAQTAILARCPHPVPHPPSLFCQRELEQIGIQADAYDAQQLHALLQKFEIKGEGRQAPPLLPPWAHRTGAGGLFQPSPLATHPHSLPALPTPLQRRPPATRSRSRSPSTSCSKPTSGPRAT